jgi:hypothetical protein
MVLVKRYEGDCRGGVLVVEIDEGYYSSNRYVISDSHFLDNNRRADLFDSYAPPRALARIGGREVKSAGRP